MPPAGRGHGGIKIIANSTMISLLVKLPLGTRSIATIEKVKVSFIVVLL